MSAASGRGAAVRVVLVGATGRMGVQIVRLLATTPGVRLVGAVAGARSAALGRDAGTHAGVAPCGVAIGAALAPLLSEADVVLDFSVATAVQGTLSACASAGVALLIGATGLPSELSASLQAAAERIALMVAPNTSVGVSLLLELVERAARALPGGYDIEILDVHHRHKVDAPSGTALALGRAAAQARGQSLEKDEQGAGVARLTPCGPRALGQIGFAALRGGDVVGEHEVRFLGEGESLVLQHRVSDRAVFARGALLAGQWLAQQPPGRYAMRDVLSVKSVS